MEVRLSSLEINLFSFQLDSLYLPEPGGSQGLPYAKECGQAYVLQPPHDDHAPENQH